MPLFSGFICNAICTVILALLLFAGVASAQPRVLRIPFHDVHSRIVLEAKLDRRPASLLLDTGAAHSFTLSPYEPIVLAFDNDEISFKTVQTDGRTFGFATPDDVHVQAFVGTDLLKHFHAVRIDYENSVLELEAK